MSLDRLLQRIFSLARRAPADEIPAMPFGWETAILTHWQAARAQRLGGTRFLLGMRWAALMACTVALLAGLLASDELAAFGYRNDPESRIAESAIVAGYGYE